MELIEASIGTDATEIVYGYLTRPHPNIEHIRREMDRNMAWASDGQMYKIRRLDCCMSSIYLTTYRPFKNDSFTIDYYSMGECYRLMDVLNVRGMIATLAKYRVMQHACSSMRKVGRHIEFEESFCYPFRAETIAPSIVRELEFMRADMRISL